MKNKYNELFTQLSLYIDDFIGEVLAKKSGMQTTDEWTVKDQLCHIVFWHENYAANYKALVDHKIPPLPEGMSTINLAGVLSLRKHSTSKLIARLEAANESLHTSIVIKKVPMMTYSKGGRTYETADFLVMIGRHIDTHTKLVKRAR